MNSTETITALQKQIEAERAKINRCQHSYADAQYDPDYKNVLTGYETRRQGVDTWQEATGYRQEQVDRWSKACVKCGHKIYTHKTEAIIAEYRPKF